MPDAPKEAAYFVVQRGVGGRECPMIVYDRLPSDLTRKIPAGERSPLVYALRLDTLPDSARWMTMPLGQLFEAFKRLRDADKLPPSNLAGPKREAAKPAVRQLGEWWEPPPRTWDPDQPTQRFPVP